MYTKKLRRSNNLLFALVLMLSVFGVTQIGDSFAASDNDIIYGGVSSESDLRNAYNNGDGRNSAANIQAIFQEAIGVMSADEFRGMDSGYVHRDGRVTVDGQTVATDAQSSGRLNFRNSRPLGDTGAYYHRTDIRFSQSTNRLPVLVAFDDRGQYEFAVITNCGNPVIATPVKVIEKEVVVEKPVERIVEKEVIVEKPVEKIVEVEKEVEVERVIEKEVEVKEEVPEELPDTGFGGAALGIFGSGALGVGLRGWMMSRRKLLSSLLG